MFDWDVKHLHKQISATEQKFDILKDLKLSQGTKGTSISMHIFRLCLFKQWVYFLYTVLLVISHINFIAALWTV